jgi:hypothetical protein
MKLIEMSLFATIRRNRPGFPDSACVCELGVLLLSLWLCPSLNTSPADLLKFQSPSFEEPYYRIQIPFEVKGDKVLIQNLLLNGAKAGPFLVFKRGKNMDLSSPLEGGAYTFVLDYAWAGGKKYRATLVYQPEKAEILKTVENTGLSPQKGGIPGGREGLYRVYQVEEEADLEPPDIVIFDGTEEVPFEIMERMESVPPDALSATHSVTSTLKIVLPLSTDLPQRLDTLLKKLRHPLRVL